MGSWNVDYYPEIFFGQIIVNVFHFQFCSGFVSMVQSDEVKMQEQCRGFIRYVIGTTSDSHRMWLSVNVSC